VEGKLLLAVNLVHFRLANNCLKDNPRTENWSGFDFKEKDAGRCGQPKDQALS
jgi:hypothetical protein